LGMGFIISALYNLNINRSTPDSMHCFVCFWLDNPQWAKASSFTRFLDHTQTHSSRYDFSGRVISSSQRPLPDNTQHSQQTDRHAPGGIRTHILSRRAAADLRVRPDGQWDRPRCTVLTFNSLYASDLGAPYGTGCI